IAKIKGASILPCELLRISIVRLELSRIRDGFDLGCKMPHEKLVSMSHSVDVDHGLAGIRSTLLNRDQTIPGIPSPILGIEYTAIYAKFSGSLLDFVPCQSSHDNSARISA